jgi:beta-glucosidase
MFGGSTPASVATAVDQASAEELFNVVTDEIAEGADEENLTAEDIVRRTDFAGVDFALIKVDSPSSPGNMFTGTGYDINVRNVPGDEEFQGVMGPTQLAYREDAPLDNGYFPKTVQYREYTADPEIVRAKPIATDPDEEERWVAAGGEAGMSRYYGGKSVTSTNEGELDFILETAENIGGLPLVVVVAANSAMVFNEFESEAEAIVLSFGTSDAAFLEIVAGTYCPNGLLPIQMPANMETVETQLEDVPFDMECHVDSDGNTYDFGFGLNWNGVINDARMAKYTK